MPWGRIGDDVAGGRRQGDAGVIAQEGYVDDPATDARLGGRGVQRPQDERLRSDHQRRGSVRRVRRRDDPLAAREREERSAVLGRDRSPTRKFVSPTKSATKRLTGRS